ncbi:disulfide bond formation protein B [Candidatus Cytomitobacter primus]|uniref:Disulfide bond formation protein B n=2 Tax=Candidatus Cytomitobacter primus TaxID=2066024 RepID=A0A5C0UED0_9PROT|nr:disulfide bond formation protein B [Candidatus Cytomitobacter primus]
MRNKYIVNGLLMGILVFSFTFMNYMRITPCLFCVLARWLFFISLIFSWLSLFSHKYLYVAFYGLITNVIIGSTSMYFLLMEVEPEWCKIGVYGSCTDWNTFLFLPMQFWITLFSMVTLFFARKALKET